FRRSMSRKTKQSVAALEAFAWSPQPAAFAFVTSLCDDFLNRCPSAASLAQRMRDETGTRFVDWVDHIRLNRRDPRAQQLNSVGYQVSGEGDGYTILSNETGMFPPILVWDDVLTVAIKVESVVDFLAANRLQRAIN